MTYDTLQIGLTSLTGLLGEFAQGNIIDPRAEREGMRQHAGRLLQRWDRRFPGFPDEYFPFTSFRGEYYRGKRDAYLKNIIVQLLAEYDGNNRVVVNAACVFGRHARDLAFHLPTFKVIGTDIDPRFHRIYTRILRRRSPENYEFQQDDIFEPRVAVKPAAVVFFGACGSISDGAMDYAIAVDAPYLMCRTCCHDNIGGNTTIARRFTYLNLFFRFKNRSYARLRGKPKYQGYYFSDRYSREQYPRSQAARGVSHSDEFLRVSQHSVDSDICRAIIDLDRYLYLMENGYDVVYKGELFVACRAGEISGHAPCVARSKNRESSLG